MKRPSALTSAITHNAAQDKFKLGCMIRKPLLKLQSALTSAITHNAAQDKSSGQKAGMPEEKKILSPLNTAGSKTYETE